MTDLPEPADAVVIERVLDVPIALAWQMWVDPGHFASWYGPPGASISVVEMDVRPGGARLIEMAMQTPDGSMSMWFAGEYLEVVEPTVLVYTEWMADADGGRLTSMEAGMPPGHPSTTTVSVELTELGGATRIVMTHEGIPHDSPGAMGWQMAFDKLGVYVADGARG